MLKTTSKISYISLYYTSILLVVIVFVTLALLMQNHFREFNDRQKVLNYAYNQAQLNAANFRVNLQQVRYLFERNINQPRNSLETVNTAFREVRKLAKSLDKQGVDGVYQSVTMAFTAFYNASHQQHSEESASDSVRIMYDSSAQLLDEVLNDTYRLPGDSRLADRFLMLIERLVENLTLYSQQDVAHNQEIQILLQKNQDYLAINAEFLNSLKLPNAGPQVLNNVKKLRSTHTQLMDNVKKLRSGLDATYSNFDNEDDFQEDALLGGVYRAFSATNALLSIYVTELPKARAVFQLEQERLVDSKMAVLGVIMLLVAVIGILTIYWIQRIVQQRVESISSHVTAIEGGDYTQRRSVASSDDLGRLSTTINEVALSLEEKDVLIQNQLKLLANSELELQQANKLLEFKVTERTRELKLASRVIDSIDEAVMIIDRQNLVLSINPAYTRITGYEIGDVIHSMPAFMTQAGMEDAVNVQLQQTGKWVGEYKNPCKNGQYCLVRISLILLFDEQNIPSHSVAIITDITEQKRYEGQLEKFAYYDPLTQLPNRRLYRERLDHICGSGQRDGLKRALLFIDLDDFKKVNDSLGHEAGDIVLLTVSKRLSHAVKRQSDYICRLGGDEFTALLDPIQSSSDIAKIAADIIRDIQIPISIFGENITVGCSIGIAEYPKDGQDYTTLNRCADLAMYKAKANGKNTYVFYVQDLDNTRPEQLNMDIELYRALENKEFVLHYQPQWSLDGAKLVGFEALLRWQHNGTLIAPDKFIPLLESNRRIIEVGLWVIKQSMRDINRWQQQYGRIIPVAVNVSAIQLSDPGFVNKVIALKKEYAIGAGALEFEITESLMMGCVDESAKVQKELVKQGISIAVDDFGTGYSSMLYLKHFPVQTLKIDRCFIHDICHSMDSQAIVLAVFSLAEKLSLKVVAEGVENIEQLETLKRLNEKGIPIACQGFYFSPAVDIVAIDSIIRHSEGVSELL
ncbi:MAG: EAL domain-containing protein [Oceanospirillaceae bacterium]|nr:EAL domain-containing protein [Oceanospirillaceae bacterium]